MTTKRALVLGVVAALAVSGIAIAYFTTSGTGTGSATVGTSTALTVAQETSTGTMYPGEGASTIAYSVTNPGPGNQIVHTTTTEVAKGAGGGILEGGVEVAGCKQSWFSTANTPPAETDLAKGASVKGSVVVTMENAAVSQDACKNKKPDITINAS